MSWPKMFFYDDVNPRCKENETKNWIVILLFFKRAAAAVISSRSSNVLHPPRSAVYVISSKNQKLDVNGTQKRQSKIFKKKTDLVI